jgi:hypothetical protein
MKKHHKIGRLAFCDKHLEIEIDGVRRKFELGKISPKLRRASREQLEQYVISPSGYGIHWPAIDEDLSIDALLGIAHRPEKLQKTA